MIQQISNEQSNETIQEDIGQTRQRMDSTLDRLVSRFQLRHLLNDLVDFWQSRRGKHPGPGDGRHIAESIQHNAKRVTEALVDQIREHPVPTLLVGAGIAWLIFESRQEDEYVDWVEDPDLNMEGDLEASHSSYESGVYGQSTTYDQPEAQGSETAGQKIGKTVEGAREKASQLAGAAGSKLRQSGRRLRERFGHRRDRLQAQTREVGHDIGDRVRHGYEQAQERLSQGCHYAERRLRESASAHPLATAAACMGVGLLVGFLLPKSRYEDQWMGETADDLRHRVKEAGKEVMSRGKHVAQAATQAAKSEAEKQGFTPEHLKEGLQAVGKEAKEAAKRTAEKEGIGPESIKQKVQESGSKQPTAGSSGSGTSQQTTPAGGSTGPSTGSFPGQPT
jgi:ElaB/YqjD/DUF883 family membrane-anchored ribosome-binding protein